MVLLQVLNWNFPYSIKYEEICLIHNLENPNISLSNKEFGKTNKSQKQFGDTT